MSEFAEQALRGLAAQAGELCRAHGAGGPGFCAALVVKGEVLAQHVHGLAHLEWQQPIDADTRFYLASEAKPWTAAFIMRSVAAGKIALDEDVRGRLPALASYTQPILLGHLLRHASGIEDYLTLWHAQLGRGDHDVLQPEQALELIRRAHDVRFTPGSQYAYSNSNYVLLAELLAQLEGCSLAELAAQLCFEPWRMPSTSFEREPWRVMPRRARSYEPDALHPGAWLDAPVPLATWGDGGLWSTLADLTQAERQWQQDPQGPAHELLLARCCAEDERFAPLGQTYRFGVEVLRHAGREFAFHGGCYASFTSLVLRCPSEQLSLLVLSNREGFDARGPRWLKAVWGDR